MMTKEQCVNKALSLFEQGYGCTQSVLLTFAPLYNLDTDIAMRLAFPFNVGMSGLREKCGALTGSFMVVGLGCGGSQPRDVEARRALFKKVRELNKGIEEIYGTSSCGELLKRDAEMKFEVRNADEGKPRFHKNICHAVVADAVSAVYDVVFANAEVSTPSACETNA
ncbi:MAG: C_GCAxxG_C_C family protein [Bacteroidales bacterium]|nr:C_GCAxxG_C_C family protein [Bacteroidales bacterium]MBN2748553.1 C_GCAxxG_C_C family protein [Bacteroidales bacterium]